MRVIHWPRNFVEEIEPYLYVVCHTSFKKSWKTKKEEKKKKRKEK